MPISPPNSSDDLIAEGIVTTVNPDGSANISPMGPRVNRDFTRLVLRPFQSHKFRLQVLPIQYQQSAIVTRDIIFNGQRYTVGAPVNSSLDWRLIRMGYEYDFVTKNRGFAGLILEAKYTDVTVNLSAPIVGTEFAHAPVRVAECAEQLLSVSQALRREVRGQLQRGNLCAGGRVVFEAERVERRPECAPALADDRLLPLVQPAAHDEERMHRGLGGLTPPARQDTPARPRLGHDRAERRARAAGQRLAVEPGAAGRAAGQPDRAGDPVVVGLRRERADDRELVGLRRESASGSRRTGRGTRAGRSAWGRTCRAGSARPTARAESPTSPSPG